MSKKRTLVGMVLFPVVLLAQAVRPEADQTESGVAVVPGGTALAAAHAVMAQVPNYMVSFDLLAESELASLTAATNRFDTAGKKIQWNKALDEVLRPLQLRYFEDGTIVKIGTGARVDALYAALEADRLAANQTRIDPDFSGGTDIYMALRTIQMMAGINMNFDYMKSEHRGVVQAAVMSQANRPLVVEAQSAGVKTTYAVPVGQKCVWRGVLKEVLDPIGYTFVEDSGTVKPMPVEQLAKFTQAKINAKPLVTRVIAIHHASPEVIVEKLTKMKLTQHEGAFIDVSRAKDDNSKTYKGTQAGVSVGAGTQVGAQIGASASSAFSNLERPRTPPGVIVADVEENLTLIEQRIRAMDIRERQVLIEALILDLSDDKSKEFGVKWTSNNKDGSLMSGAVKWGGAEWKENNAAPPRMDWDWLSKGATLGGVNFSAVIKWVQTDSNSKILGNPIITVGDHAEALIQVGQADPIPQVSTTLSGGNAGSIAQSVEWLILTTGTTLWVSPEISENQKQIRLAVHPQITEANVKNGQSITIYTGSQPTTMTYPEVSTRELDTRVTVTSGDTLLLGGLIHSEDSYVVDKVPILGDIPYLGRLFRSTVTTTIQRHLVLLIRPTVLDDEAPDTGYEKPSLKIIEPLLSGVGRNVISKHEDPIEKGELAVKRYLGFEEKGAAVDEPKVEVLNHGSAEVGTTAK